MLGPDSHIAVWPTFPDERGYIYWFLGKPKACPTEGSASYLLCSGVTLESLHTCYMYFECVSLGVGPLFHYKFSHVCVLSCFSCVQLCDTMDCSPLGSSVYGILQARIREWVAMPSSMGSSQPRDGTRIFYVSCIGRWILLTLAPPGKPKLTKAQP